MKICYLGRQSRKNNPEPNLEGDVLELLANNWDDYGNRTTFMTTCRIAGEQVELGHLKLMVRGSDVSEAYLDKLLKKGWDGIFPIPNTSYISLPAEITFYEQLRDRLGADIALESATVLRDASYLIHISHDSEAIELVATQPFRLSLQRERGAVKSFLDGWKIFAAETMAVLDLGFKFRDVYDDISVLNLKFRQRGLLPHSVNVLIGPNGVGKSQLLHQIIKSWLSNPEEGSEEEAIGFVEKPNLSQIVVVSYSPFERFPVDLEAHSLQDKDVYRYFGFRGRSVTKNPAKRAGIVLTHQAPKKNAASSLLDCLADDLRFGSIRSWSRKLSTFERVLRTAFDFDYATVNVGKGARVDALYTEQLFEGPPFFELEGERYVPISEDRIGALNLEYIRKKLIASSGVTFFRDGDIVHLSSGQKLFSFIVINILGAIRRDSLILIDEPELFLHPTLEIQFIDMLKKILDRFNSKALLATHSLVTVREVPTECVHVLARTKDGLTIRTPPFQTFGGDMQRISSYVFGDNNASKPFERWIKEQLEAFGSADQLINALGTEINEELSIQIQGMEREGW